MEATTRSSSSRGLHELAVLASSKWKEVRLWGPRLGTEKRRTFTHEDTYDVNPPSNLARRPSSSSDKSSNSSSFSFPYAGGKGAATRLNEEEAYKRERAEENRIAYALRNAMDDIDSLWMDPIVRGLPSVKRLWLEEHPGLYAHLPSSNPILTQLHLSFLDSLDRVTQPNYLPTEGDILLYMRIYHAHLS